MRRPTLVTLSIFFATVLAATALLLAYPDTSGAKQAGKASGKYKGLRMAPTQTGPFSGLRKTDRLPVMKENFRSYSQVVDNATSKRVQAPGWTKKTSKPGSYGESYRVSKARGKAKAARYKVKVPASDVYSVFAWWPNGLDKKASARFGVSTVAGAEWSTVDQSRDGGYWVPIGEYRMKKGQNTVRVLPNSSEPVVVDAVAVVRGVLDFPPPPKKQRNGGKRAEVASGGMIYGLSGDSSTAGSSADEAFDEVAFTMAAATAGRITPRAITRRAVSQIGTPYGNRRCKWKVQEDCSCFTRLVFYKWKRLPDSPKWQWNYGRRIPKRYTSRGDLVFFDIDRDGVLEHWDHVGIYLGNGYLIHANSYYKYRKVHRQKMRWVPGYWGTKRLR